MATRTRINANNLTDADRQQGQRFGCSGTVTIREAVRMFGVCQDTGYARIGNGILRQGETTGRPRIRVESLRRHKEPVEA